MIEQLFKFNCSTLFLLYPLGLSIKSLKEFGFINCFLSDKDRETACPFPILLLFKPADMEVMQMFIEEEYRRTDHLIEEYDYDGGYVVLVYKFPVKWKEDYQKFLDGKYSKFSRELKSTYPKIVQITDTYGRRRDELGSQFRIINKTADWKEQMEKDLNIVVEDDLEYWSKPDIEGREVLDIQKIKSM